MPVLVLSALGALLIRRRLTNFTKCMAYDSFSRRLSEHACSQPALPSFVVPALPLSACARVKARIFRGFSITGETFSTCRSLQMNVLLSCQDYHFQRAVRKARATAVSHATSACFCVVVRSMAGASDEPLFDRMRFMAGHVVLMQVPTSDNVPLCVRSHYLQHQANPSNTHVPHYTPYFQ